MTHSKILIAIPFLALSACATMEQSATSRLGPSPALAGGTYSSGGGLTFASEIQQVDGATALCGVRTEEGRQSVYTLDKASRVAASGSAYVDGQLLHRGLVFMRKVEPSESYAGLEANCVITERRWQASDEGKQVEIRIPRQVVHREGDDLMGGGLIITFRQSDLGT